MITGLLSKILTKKIFFYKEKENVVNVAVVIIAIKKQ